MHGCFRSHAFLISFVSTVLVLLLFFGMLAVDAEGRRLSFGDTAPPFEVAYNTDGTAELKINAFSLDKSVPVTGLVRSWHFVADFLCIPHRKFPPIENTTP